MWENSENWKFVGSSQQLLKWILPVLIRDHRYIYYRCMLFIIGGGEIFMFKSYCGFNTRKTIAAKTYW